MDGSETTSRLFTDGMRSAGSKNVDSKFDVSQETNELMTENTSTLFSTEESQDFVAGIQTAARITPQPRVVSLPKVTVFLGAQASQNGLTNTFAVAGLTLSETYLQEVLRRFPHCDNGDTCYLLDDAAFVMAVNNGRLNYQIGHFLGHVDPPLMESLLENLVYSRVRYYDHQAVCDSAHLGEKNSTASATNLFPVIYIVISTELSQRPLSTVLSQFLAVGPSEDPGDAFALDQGVDYVNCVKSTYRYYATDGANFRKEPFSSVEVTGSFSCSPECTRQWSSSSIPETNLKLIKTDPLKTFRFASQPKIRDIDVQSQHVTSGEEFLVQNKELIDLLNHLPLGGTKKANKLSRNSSPSSSPLFGIIEDGIKHGGGPNRLVASEEVGIVAIGPEPFPKAKAAAAAAA
eukprot:TsM_000896200 transcript=TsM_000896200 gene=TsM_000896200